MADENKGFQKESKSVTGKKTYGTNQPKSPSKKKASSKNKRGD